MAPHKRIKMTDNRGTVVSIPIRFHVGSFRLNWRVVHDRDTTLFVGSALGGTTGEGIELGDGWELVRRYLSVIAEDEQSILGFLVAHGRVEFPRSLGEHARVKYKPDEVGFDCFSLRGFATAQDYVRRMLVTGNPTLPTPWRGGIQRYEIAFTATRYGSEAHVMVGGVFPSILATVQFKLAQGAKFRTCARKDCRLPFEVTSRHARRFCTQYCAHITSLRQLRRLNKKRSKENKTGGSLQYRRLQ
jgi:hypothetical protein